MIKIHLLNSKIKTSYMHYTFETMRTTCTFFNLNYHMKKGVINTSNKLYKTILEEMLHHLSFELEVFFKIFFI